MKFRPLDSRNTSKIVPPPEAYYHSQDEVSLIELWEILIRKKNIIIITVVVCVVLAVGYLLTQPKVYKSEVSFAPPSATDIHPFNIIEIAGFTGFTAEALYSRFLGTISSNAVYRKVFDEAGVVSVMGGEGQDDKNVFFQGFTESLQHHIPTKEQGADYSQPASLSLEGTNPELISRYLNAVVKEANSQVITEAAAVVQQKIDARLHQVLQEIARSREIAVRQRQDEVARMIEQDGLARQQILDEIAIAYGKAEKKRIAEISRLQEEDNIKRQKLLDEIATLREHENLKRKEEIVRLEEEDRIKREQIKETISTLRSNAKTKRLDRIAALQEAANIAQKIELTGAIVQSDAQRRQAVIDGFGLGSMPLYLLGEKALRAEIEGLLSRSSDDPFIPGLRSLQDQLKQLETNEKIEALKSRRNHDPFIAGLPELLDQLKQLETNERIAALKSRKSNAPFIPELIELEARLQRLENNRLQEKLQSRVNDDSFIPELRELELEEQKLRTFLMDTSQTFSVKIDQAAYPAGAPHKPRSDLILILGAISGLMLGVLFAFFAHFIATVRLKKSVS